MSKLADLIGRDPRAADGCPLCGGTGLGWGETEEHIRRTFWGYCPTPGPTEAERALVDRSRGWARGPLVSDYDAIDCHLMVLARAKAKGVSTPCRCVTGVRGLEGVAVPLLLAAGLSWLSFPVGRECPACGMLGPCARFCERAGEVRP